MKKYLFLFVLIIQTISAFSTTYSVGSTRAYISPNALYSANMVQDGDTIEIDAETYAGQAALAVWQAHDLVIKGIGGQPQLLADGQYIWGKGIWVLAGNNITVENIAFSGAAVPDQNGAGIRLDGIGLTVRHCYFHNNENGILTSNPYAGDILIEYSEFGHNGHGDGYSHNLYIGHVNKLTFRYNYSHHAIIGHNLKSRANENHILYNRIMDEETGNSSRLIDLPNGGISIVMGNLLMQGNYAENNNLVGYGKEGLSNSGPHEIYFINNTLVNKRVASCLFLDIQNGTSFSVISNNIFVGTGIIINGPTTIMGNNIIETDIADLHFVDEANYDYHLNINSPAIDFGIIINPINGHSLTPEASYIHPLNYEARTVVNSAIDAGAYEFGNMVSNSNEPVLAGITIYPNPTTGILNIGMDKHEINRVFICNDFGQMILMKKNTGMVDLSGMVDGVYYLEIESGDGVYYIKRVVKRSVH